MRVLVLGSKEYPVGTSDDPLPSGGMESYTQRFAKELSKREEVIIVTRKFSSTPKEGHTGSITVYRVPWFGGFYLRTPSFAFFSFFKGLGIKYDVAVCNGVFATLTGILLRAFKKEPVIARPAGIASVQSQYVSLLQRVLRALEKFAYGSADAVILLSDGEKRQFKAKLGFEPKKTAVIPTGINAAKFGKKSKKVRRELKLGESLVITFVGRLIEVKGLTYLLEAFSRLVGVGKRKVRLLIVGDGPQREKLEEQAKRLGIDDKVVFLGTRHDVPDILASSDVFVLPSESEGLPVALLEAMASSLPCVVTDIGLPVEDGKDAVVVRPKDSKALARALSGVVKSSALRKKLGANAKKKALGFTWKKTVDMYVDLMGAL